MRASPRDHTGDRLGQIVADPLGGTGPRSWQPGGGTDKIEQARPQDSLISIHVRGDAGGLVLVFRAEHRPCDDAERDGNHGLRQVKGRAFEPLPSRKIARGLIDHGVCQGSDPARCEHGSHELPMAFPGLILGGQQSLAEGGRQKPARDRGLVIIARIIEQDMFCQGGIVGDKHPPRADSDRRDRLAVGGIRPDRDEAVLKCAKEFQWRRQVSRTRGNGKGRFDHGITIALIRTLRRLRSPPGDGEVEGKPF